MKLKWSYLAMQCDMLEYLRTRNPKLFFPNFSRKSKVKPNEHVTDDANVNDVIFDELDNGILCNEIESAF